MSTVPDTETARLVEAAQLIIHDAGREWDHLALFHATMREYYSGDPSLTFGTGETVPRAYVRMRARAVFFQTLHRLVPESTPALLTDDAYAIVEGISEARRNWRDWSEAEMTAGRWDLDTLYAYPPLIDALRREAAHIRAWQERYNLHDEWIADAARFTMTTAAAMRWEGETYDYPVSVSNPAVNVHEGKEAGGKMFRQSPNGRWIFRFTPTHKLQRVPVYLEDLRHPPYEVDGHEVEDEGEFSDFDPRAETVDAAVKRIMPALEARLRRALEQIKADDKELNDAIDPPPFRKPTPFEWLVRFQVPPRESRRQISFSLAEAKWGSDPDWERLHNPYDSTGHVGKQIKRVADLIGLTLGD